MAYLREYWLRHNRAFGVRAQEAGAALVPLLEVDLNEILCLKETRVVRNDNCVAYQGKRLQIPPQQHRIHYVRAEVEVREYEDGRLAVFHDQLRLGRYAPDGRLEQAPGRARVAPGGTRKADTLRATKTGHVHLLLTPGRQWLPNDPGSSTLQLKVSAK